MKILIACEYTGIVRDCFIAMGHEAVSCDILPSESPGPHIQDDVRHHLVGWDLIIAHPPCTYICSSGLHWNKRRPEREQLTKNALDFVQTIWDAPCPLLAIENPVGCISTRLNLPKPQYIQPWQFGDDASKKTGLWKRNLPDLIPTDPVEPRLVNGKPRWANQTDSGQNREPPSASRGQDRSRTYFGIASAMALQWGSQ
jgi:hypothetical protein